MFFDSHSRSNYTALSEPDFRTPLQTVSFADQILLFSQVFKSYKVDLISNYRQFMFRLLNLLLLFQDDLICFLQPCFFLLKDSDPRLKLLQIYIQFFSRLSNFANIHFSRILLEPIKDFIQVWPRWNRTIVATFIFSVTSVKVVLLHRIIHYTCDFFFLLNLFSTQ